MDTAQPVTAAETDPVAAAAEAFKAHLGQTPQPARDEAGRFASTREAEIEAEAEEAALATDAEAESHDAEEITDEAADEAQPEAVDLPPSWPSEHAETWNALPPETQAFIAEREGQREAAVNAKFQEAANVRKANEAVIAEANANRQKFAEAADTVLSLVKPQRPSTALLTAGSPDYNPDLYHLQLAQAEETEQLIRAVQQHRSEAVAQLQTDMEQAERQALEEIEAKSRPALLKDIPDLADPQKQAPVLQGLVQYAIGQGIPEHVFSDPEIVRGVTSAQLHLVWKAQQYDKMVTAKATVTPKAAKPAAPAVRAGVATSQSAVKNAERKKVTDRLAREGSVEAGAALFRTLKF